MSGVYLSSLLEGNFDENVFVSKAFEANNLVEALKTVSEKLSELDASIYQHVSKNNSDLLSQAVELENFSNIVESVESRILGVSSNVKMIKQRLTKQYEHLLSQVTQIRRLGHIYDTLRNIHRISSTSKKLFESSDNLVLASECIEELDYAFSTVDWKGIDILEEYYENLEKEKDRVAKQVWELVQSSLDACEQSRLGVGLQAFEKLSVLPKIIQALVSDWQAEIEGAVKSAVDIEDINKKAKGKVISALTSTTPGKASLPSNGGQVAAFRNLLWTRLDQMVNLIERRLTQSRLLCVTLQKKRPSTGIPSSSATLASRLCSFLMEKADDPQEKDCCSAIIFVLSTEELNSDGDSVKTKLADLKVRHAHYFSESYYNGLLGWVATCMSAVFEPALRRRSGQLKDVLESDYPRMLKLFLNLSGHQRHLSRPIERFLAPFETAYLARCLTRLFDRVNSTFIGVTPVESVGGNLPRITDIEQVVQSAATELAHSAAVHPELFCKVARNVAKMVALFATKVEALIVTSPEASQVSIDGLLNPAQQTNSHLVNFTCAFVDRLRMAVARHTTNQQQKRGHAKAGADDAQAIVDHAISSKLSGVCLAALEPLLTGIADHVIDQILPRMHKEALDNLEDPAYVQDLQIFVNRIRSVYLAGFSTSTSTTSCCLRSANVQLFTSGEAAVRFGLQSRVLPRCLDALAVHSSLFRPCTGDVERSRLTTSNAAIEVALAALAPPSTFTDDPFIRLRALRQLFSTPTDEILSVTKTIEFQSDARGAVGFVGSSLPGSLALHHVIARSPNEIPLPHETASGWTLERYVRWCQAVADEPTRLAFISKSLDVYAEQVEARKQRVYPQLYIVVRDMLESCAAETSTA